MTTATRQWPRATASILSISATVNSRTPSPDPSAGSSSPAGSIPCAGFDLTECNVFSQNLKNVRIIPARLFWVRAPPA